MSDPDPGTPEQSGSHASSRSGWSGRQSSTHAPSNIQLAIQLSPEEPDDLLNGQTIKPYVEFRTGGGNIDPWKMMIDAQCLAKRGHMALHKYYPNSAVDAAATAIIMGSLPGCWQNVVAKYPTAHQRFQYIVRKFTGGHNQEANLVWMRGCCLRRPMKSML